METPDDPRTLAAQEARRLEREIEVLKAKRDAYQHVADGQAPPAVRSNASAPACDLGRTPSPSSGAAEPGEAPCPPPQGLRSSKPERETKAEPGIGDCPPCAEKLHPKRRSR